MGYGIEFFHLVTLSKYVSRSVAIFQIFIFKNAAVFELPYCTIHIKSLESESENDNSGECAVNTYLQHCGMCRVIVNCRSKGMNLHAGSKFYTF